MADTQTRTANKRYWKRTQMNETMTSNNLDAQKIGRETFGCVRWAVPLWSGAWLGTLCLGFQGDMVRVWLFMIVGIG